MHGVGVLMTHMAKEVVNALVDDSMCVVMHSNHTLHPQHAHLDRIDQ